MPKRFPTAGLSRKPTPGTWQEETAYDPTIRTKMDSGDMITRSRYTAMLKRFTFSYRYMTAADRVLIVDYEEHVKVGADKFEFRHPIRVEDWEVRLLSPIRISVEPRDPTKYKFDIELFGKQVDIMRTEIYWVEDLGAGVDISNRPIFVNPEAVTINSIGILTQGSPAGVDDSNTVVIALKDDASNSIVSKTYDADPQPPSSDYEDLGSLSAHASLAAGEHLLLDVIQGATANLPVFGIVIEWYYTS